MSAPRRPLKLSGGHLGPSVSALLDGQLDPVSTERAWAHAMLCAPCRELVEHEGWTKRQLAQIAAGGEAVTRPAPADLVGSLLDLDAAAIAWAGTDEIERSSRGRRRAGLALIGVGSVSAAVLGLTVLSASPVGGGGTPAGNIGGAGSGPAPTTAAVAPAGQFRGGMSHWVLDDQSVPRTGSAATRR